MATEFMLGDDLSTLTVPLDGHGWDDVDLTGAIVQLEAASRDIGAPVMLAGTVNVADRTATFAGIGAQLSSADLAPKRQARYTARAHLTAAGGPQGFGQPFEFTIIENPLGGVITTASGPSHPFEFPFPTGTGRVLHSGPVVYPSFTNGQRVVLLSKPAGASGVVRDILWIVSSTVAPLALTLEVTVDGEASPAISVPLMVTAGIERPLSLLSNLKVSTPAFEYGGNSFAPFSHFRLPIPYTNGIEVAIVAPAGAAVNTMWANVMYQDHLPACWNRNLRLRSWRTNQSMAARTFLSGTTQLTDATHLVATNTLPADIAGCAIGASYCPNDIHVIERTDDTHAVVSSKDTALATFGVSAGTSRYFVHEWLNRPADKAGWLAMVVAAMSSTPGDIFYTMEANVRLLLDGHAEADLTWTSIEDMFNGAYYFENVQNQFEDGGIMCRDAVAGNYSLYKLFHRYPVRYGAGIRGLVPLWATVPTTCNWTSFFYEES